MMATASMGMSKTIQAVRPHIPLIKFRKGGSRTSDGPVSFPGQQRGPSQELKKQSVGPYIDDTQLPDKYRRKPLSPVEMEYINRGGPE